MFKKLLALLIIFSGLSLCAMEKPSTSSSSTVKGKEKELVEFDTRQALWGNLAILPNELLIPIFLDGLKKNFNPDNSFDWRKLGFCHAALGDKIINRELLDLRIKHGGYQEGATLEGKDDATWVTCLIKIDERTIASGFWVGTIKIWQKDEDGCYQEVAELGHSERTVYCLIKIDEKTIASGSGDGTIKLWHKNKDDSWSCFATLTGHSNTVKCLIKIDETTIASGSSDGTIKLWQKGEDGSWQEVETLIILTGAHPAGVYCLIKVDETTIAYGSADGTINIWHKGEDGSWYYFATLRGHSDYVRCLIKIDETTIASGSADGTINIWQKGEDGKWSCISTLTEHSSAVRCLIKIDERTIASGAWDMTMKVLQKDTIKLWQKGEDGKWSCIATLTGHSSCCTCLLKLDEEILASGAVDVSIKLWKLKTIGQMLAEKKEQIQKRREQAKRLDTIFDGMKEAGIFLSSFLG